ncbi:unnamed protein product [Rotaria sordida]|uniref:DUF4062 domain-containing protein n=1 Tax=Rotaria sordida TaxID=392033 RepID=A0A813TF50_9BILA|nr:unnamed protein product [Rotaria sordida]
MGYEPVLFESGDIPFKQDLSLDESCYKEIENSHMQILIIGGNYGSPDSKTTDKPKNKDEKMYQFFNSITKIEYKTAIEKGIPVFIFVEKQVLAEYETFKHNRENPSTKYAHVDSINVFKLIDEIFAQKTGNYIKGFEKFEDISSWLKEQWAGIFAEYLKNNRNKIEIKALSSKINELGSITGALKEYTEAIMRKIQPDDYEKLIDEEDKRIEAEKAISFRNESMIMYIIHDGKIKITPTQIYKHFKSADTLEEFVAKLKIKDEISKYK